jgi:hypothetical protein
MRTLGTVLVSFLTMLFATHAHPGDGDGEVGKVVVGRVGEQVFVELLNAQIRNFPCSNTHPNGYQYAFSLQTHAAGKAMLATILAVKGTGKRLFVQGNAICTISSNLEDVSYVIALP